MRSSQSMRPGRQPGDRKRSSAAASPALRLGRRWRTRSARAGPTDGCPVAWKGARGGAPDGSSRRSLQAEAASRCGGGTRRQLRSSARSSRSIAELLLIHHPAERGRHAGALVEAERAGVARHVDAEPDAVLAALPEAPERVAEERRAHALLAPRATREERVDPAAAVRVARADRPGGDLVPGADHAPERRVEALAPEVAL